MQSSDKFKELLKKLPFNDAGSGESLHSRGDAVYGDQGSTPVKMLGFEYYL